MQQQESSRKIIDFLRLPLIQVGFRTLDKWLIQKINFEPLRTLLSRNLQLMIDVTDKLTDKDPNNNEQLKAVWELYKHGTNESLLETTITSIKTLVKDEEEAKWIIETLQLLINKKKLAAPTTITP